MDSAVLGDAAEVISGVGFPKDLQGSTDGDVPVFKVGDISNAIKSGTHFLRKSPNNLSKADASKLSKTLMPPGTIVFAKIGEGLKLNRRAVLSQPSLVDNNVMGLVPKPGVATSSYLYYFMQTVDLGTLSRATAVPSVRKSDVIELAVPLPPIAQQDEIVAEIEKQFSRLDEAVANLQRVKANLKRYKASVLKDAVEGRLVLTEAELACREGRSFETGEQLLQQILETRHSNWSGRGKFKTPDAPETMGMVELPNGWVWASVAQLADVISGLTKNPSRETLPLKLPYLRVANVYANELRLDDMTEIGVADNELQKLLVLKNDLLVVEGNGSPDQIGRVAKWDGSISPCVHQNHLIKVRAIVAEPDWMLNWLISPGGRKQIELVSSSTTGLHTLSSGKVGRLPVPLPPVAEQKRIVLEVDRRLSLIRGVESEVDANLKRAQALRQSTLSSAFQQVP